MMLSTLLRRYSHVLDTNQSAKFRLRTHVHLPRTSTEQSLSKSRVTDPCEASLYDDPSDGHHKRRRTGYENLSGTAPTGHLPTFTASMDRTSLTSMSTADQDYACPKCNMGDGYPIRPYKRKGDTPSDRNVSAGIPDSNQQSKPPKLYKNTTCFNKHVIAAHKRDFKSSDSSDYVCRYCRCGIVDEHPICSARFEENDFDGLLQHLREFHAHPSLQYINAPHDHWCAPLYMSFQLQSLCD
jgi:hypothetical protein